MVCRPNVLIRVQYPGSTVTELVMTIAKRKIATAKAGIQYPSMPDGLFYGPRQYQPSLSKKVSALQNWFKVVPHVLQETELHMHRFYGMAISAEYLC